MELTLADIISNFLVLGLKSLDCYIEDFVSSVHFLLLTFFSIEGDSHWTKVQIPNTSGAESCNKETRESVKRLNIGFDEISMIMGRMGIAGKLEDNTGNKSLSEEDFIGLFDEEEPSLGEIKEAFEVFDVNKDGFIDAFELQRVLRSLGFREGYILEDCKRMIQAFDCNGDGVIDHVEFVKLMEKCLC